MTEKEMYQNLLDAFIDLDVERHKRIPYIKEYREIRKLHQEIINRMMEYYNQHESMYQNKLTQFLDESCNKGKINLYTFEIDFSRKLDNQVFGDLIIYNHIPGQSLCQAFINNKKVRAQRKIEFVQAMLNSKLGLFEYVENIEYGRHILKNVLSGQSIEVIDQKLSVPSGKDKVYLYDRVIEFEGIRFICGIHMFFDKNDPNIRKFIKRNKGKYRPTSQLLDLFQLTKQNEKASLRKPNGKANLN